MKFHRGTLPDVLFTAGFYLFRRAMQKKVESFAKRGKNANRDYTSSSFGKKDRHSSNDIWFFLGGAGVGLGIGFVIGFSRTGRAPTS